MKAYTLYIIAILLILNLSVAVLADYYIDNYIGETLFPHQNVPAANVRMGVLGKGCNGLNGEMYLPDQSLHRLWKVSADGMATVHAGIGSYFSLIRGGYSGENLPAAKTLLNTPRACVVDPNTGDIYVSESGHHRVRKIFANNGTIVTVAGNGILGTNTNHNNDGKATEASLGTPIGISLAPNGDLYIAESTTQVVRKVNAATGIISVVAGAVGLSGPAEGTVGISRLNTPLDVHYHSSSSSVYIADSANHAIRKIDSAGSSSTAFGTIGTSSGATNLNTPSAVFVSKQNADIYVACKAGNVIKKKVSGTVSTIIGTGTGLTTPYCYGGSVATSACDGSTITSTMKITSPDCLFLSTDENTLYYTESTTGGRLRSIALSTNMIDTAVSRIQAHAQMSGDGLSILNAPVLVYTKFAIDSDDSIYMYGSSTSGSSYDCRILKADQTTNLVYALAGSINVCSYFGNDILAKYASLSQSQYPHIKLYNGDVYFSNAGDCTLRVIKKDTQKIKTLVGTGTCSASSSVGDGGLATSAQLYAPVSFDFLSNGDIVIADKFAIRKITNNDGNINTIAGSTSSCSSNCGDDGSAVSATFNTLHDIAVHPDTQEIFILDDNKVIRKITNDNKVVKIAGTYGSACSTNSYSNACGDGGQANSAKLFGNGNFYNTLSFSPITKDLYIADPVGSNGARIRKIDLNTGIIDTVLGYVGASATLDVVTGLGENLFPGQSTAISAYVYAMTFSPKGELYYLDRLFANTNNYYVIRKFNPHLDPTSSNNFTDPSTDPRIFTVAGEFSSSMTNPSESGMSGEYTTSNTTRLNAPTVLFQKGQDLYYLESGTPSAATVGLLTSGSNLGPTRIRKLNKLTGLITTVVGSGRNIANTITSRNAIATNIFLGPNAGLSQSGLVVLNDGSIVWSDSGTHTIKSASAEITGTVSIIAGDTTACSGADIATGCGNGGVATSAKLNYPSGLFLHSDGSIYIADKGNNMVRKLLTNGNIILIAGTGASGSSGDDALASSATLNGPTSVVVDKNNNVYIADRGNHKIRRVDGQTGIITTYVGNGTQCTSSGGCGDGGIPLNANLNYPTSISIDSKGALYIADSNSHYIRYVNPDGTIIKALAGSYQSAGGFNIEGNALASSVKLNYPMGILASSDGYIYVSDTFNNRIRKISSINYCFGTISTDIGVCSGHGHCIDQDTCTCIDGYSGTDCSAQFNCFGKSINDPKACNGKGQCVSQNTCSCLQGYFGDECTVTTCSDILSNSSNICSGNGNCTDFDTCKCSTGYFGSTCNLTSCNNILSNSSDVCSSFGVCVTPDNCQCDANHFGLNCEMTYCNGIQSNSSSVCSGRGSCASFENCTCNENYFGDDCSLTTCNGTFSNETQVCSSKGTCYSYNECSCDPNYFGDVCSLTTCNGTFSNDTSVCNNLGSCLLYDECSCVENYFGETCQFTYCFGIQQNSTSVCSSQGSCIATNTCACTSDYLGEDCSVTTCYGILSNSTNVCSSTRGTCGKLDTCTCNQHYFGNQCEFTSCGLVQSNSSSVCSGKGNCSDWNSCVCETNYFGENCELTTCSSIASNSSHVCSSNGQCVDHNQCSCNYGYFGPDCSVTMCVGVFSNNTNVCSGKGNCSSLNSCVCLSNYFGDECELTTCGLIQSNSSNVCSGNGLCLEYNNCTCDSGYFGSSCSEFTCGGILNTLASVCNSHGDCYDLDKCNCTSEYNGSLCENQIDNGPTNNGNNNTSGNNSTDVNNNSTISQNSTTFDNTTFSNSSSANDNTTTIQNSTTTTSNTSSDSNSTESYNNSTTTSNSTDLNNNTTDVNNNSTMFDNSTISPNSTTLDNTTTIENNTTTTTTNTSNSTNSTTDESTESNNSTSSNNNTIVQNSTSITNNETEVVNNSTLQMNSSTSSNSTLNDNSTSGPLNTTTNSTTPTNESQNSTSNNICDKVVNCTNHGECNYGVCSCYANYENGFWSGSSCDKCSSGYYGSNCSTTIIGTARITKNFDGLTFTMTRSSRLDNLELNCNQLLSPDDINSGLFGSISQIQCFYIDRRNYIVKVLFGSPDYSILPGVTSIHINRLLFDNSMSTDYQTILVEYPLTITNPVALIDLNSELYSSCESIIIDGSRSFSVDGKPLQYVWKLLDINGNDIPTVSFDNKAIISLPSTFSPGSYKFSLTVTSNFLGKTSSIQSKLITKSPHMLPTLRVKESYNLLTTQFPETIHKVVSGSGCSNSSIAVEWNQISGPSIEYSVDDLNNLKIKKLNVFGTQTYVFRVAAYLKDVSQVTKVYSDITVYTKSPDLILDVEIMRATANYSIISVFYQDPEAFVNTATETWTWTFNSQESYPLLSKYLSDISKSKSTQVTISTSLFSEKIPSSIQLSLKIVKSDSRSVQSLVTVKFTNVPPTVIIVSMYPDISTLLPGEKLFVQTLISSPSSNLNSTWTINNRNVENNMVKQQETSLKLRRSQYSNQMTASTLVLDTGITGLEQGSSNTISLMVFDTISGISNSVSYSFDIATLPKKCSCQISPAEGVAMETDFSFACQNCQNELGTLNFNYGFIDDRSGVKIMLGNLGEVYSTKLPVSFNSDGKLSCFLDIVDTLTGAATQFLRTVTVQTPITSTVHDVNNLINKLIRTSGDYILEGDFSKAIYESVSTSRVQSVMLQNKVIPQLELSNTQSNWLQILNNLHSINNHTTINENYLTLVAFGVDSMLKNPNLLSYSTVSQILTLLNSYLSIAIDKNVKMSDNVNQLLKQSILSAYQSSPQNPRLYSTLKLTHLLSTRSIRIGGDIKEEKESFYSISKNRNTIYDYLRTLSNSEGARVILPTEFFINSGLEKNTFGFSFISTYLGIENSDQLLTTTQGSNNDEKITKTIVSPIVSFNLIDTHSTINPNGIIYEIPTLTSWKQITGRVQITDLEAYSEVKTPICYNFDDEITVELRTDCSMIGISEDSIVKCQCEKLTNVLVAQLRTTKSYYYGYIVAIVVVVVIVFCILCAVAVLLAIIALLRKRKQKNSFPNTDTEMINQA